MEYVLSSDIACFGDSLYRKEIFLHCLKFHPFERPSLCEVKKEAYFFFIRLKLNTGSFYGKDTT